MLSAENWCVKVEDKVYGPYTTEQLRKFAHEGRLARWSLIAPAGSRTWREACKESAFAAFFGAENKSAAAANVRSFGRRDGGDGAGQDRAPAMANFVIVFDIASGAALRLESAIRELGHAFQMAENVWSLTSDLTAVGVRNALAPHLASREPIFVVDASRGRTSWQNFTPEAHAKISGAFLAARAKASAA